jgi:hypothetical protein
MGNIAPYATPKDSSLSFFHPPFNLDGLDTEQSNPPHGRAPTCPRAPAFELDQTIFTTQTLHPGKGFGYGGL